MDFLSWLAWRDQMMPGADVCVLNSVSNLSKAKDWLLAHEGVRCFMDNDAAGREAYDRICEICVDRDVKDGSTVYKEYKDLNEAYVSSIQEEKTHQQSTTKSFRHGR
jgi:DNA primase